MRSGRSERDRPGRPQPAAVVVAFVVLAILATISLAGGIELARTTRCDPAEDARWVKYRSKVPGPHPNALWARHWWVGEDRSECDYRLMARHIRQLGLTDVFFHSGPFRPDGTVDPARYRYAQRLVDAMHRLVPGVRIQAYLGQFEGTRPNTDDLDLTNADNLARVVGTAKIFLDFGFDGIHYDIEPIPVDSQRFVDLFDRTRALTLERGGVLSTAIEERRPDPEDGWGIDSDRSHPTDDWLRVLSSHVDQLAVMTYDAGQKTDEDFRRWTAYQTKEIAAVVGDRTTIFMGISDGPWDGNGNPTETARNGSVGVMRGVQGLPPEIARNVGAGVFSDWITTEDEYSVIEAEWVLPSGSAVAASR